MTGQPVSKLAMAKRLGVSRAMLYYQPRQFNKDWELKVRMEKTLHDYPSYGHKRLALHLKVNKKRSLRVMKLFGIKPYRRRGRRFKKSKGNQENIRPNLLLAIMPSQINQVWASDFTHLVYQGRIIYLATVLDIFSREVVGFSVMTGHSVQLVINALLMAVTNKGPPKVIHSDQGSEYTSQIYTSLEENLGIKISMSRKASPWENGYQESFYNQFKIDLGDPNRFESLGELIAEIYQAVHVYNTQRIHTKLKMPPRHYAILKTIFN